MPLRLDFTAPDGTELLRRHPLNNWQEEVVRAHYTEGILQHGLLVGVRGQAWATPAPEDRAWHENGERLYLLAAATLTESL